MTAILKTQRDDLLGNNHPIPKKIMKVYKVSPAKVAINSGRYSPWLLEPNPRIMVMMISKV